jgi:hypothetical protein
MKYKFVLILILMSLFVTSFGTAAAQEANPPKAVNESASRSSKSSWLEKTAESASKITPDAAMNLAVTSTPVVNPGFELGQFVGWSEFSSQGWPLVVSSLPYTPKSGAWAAWLGGDFFENSILSQSGLSIISPTSLRLWYLSDSDDACGFDFGYVKVNGVILHTWNLCASTNTGGWTPLDINLNAYNGQTITLTLEVLTDGSEDSSLYIDDVSLYGTFADVPYGYWSWSYIEGLYNAGVTAGCGSGNYCPTTTVTRDQMAVFLLKAKHTSSYTPPAPTGAFSDVPTNYWAAAWIEQLADEGITAGCGGGNYCPTNPVTRDQMAVFLLKAKHGFDYVPPAATGVFQDVPVNHWAAAWVEQLADEGITAGCSTSPLLYCPGAPVSRDQMAVFLVRTFGLPTP